MVLALDYSDLSSLINTTNKIGRELNQYCDSLSTKVQSKMYEVEGGMSSSLNSADYYVKSKINKIREKEENTNTLAIKTEALLETAKTVDANVERTIQNNQTAFFKTNPDLKPANHKIALYALWTDVKNLPLIGTLLESYEQTVDAMTALSSDIRYWWECNGGEAFVKNVADIVLKIAGCTLAIVIAVGAVTAAFAAATFVTVIVAVAASIAALIAVVNTATNTIMSLKSIKANNNGDYAMSQILADRDTLSSYLREHNFHDRERNQFWNSMATGISITDQVCGVILIVSNITKATKSFGKISSKFLKGNGVSFAFKNSAMVNGQLKATTSFKSIWRGTKAMVLNQRLTSSTSAGLRSTMLRNISQSARRNITAYKNVIGGQFKYGVFKSIKETFKYQANMYKSANTMDKIRGIAYDTKHFSQTVGIITEAYESRNYLNGIKDFSVKQTNKYLYSNTKWGKLLILGDKFKTTGTDFLKEVSPLVQ